MTQTAATPAEVARDSRSDDLGQLAGFTDDRSSGDKEAGTLFKYVAHVSMEGFTATHNAVCVRDYLGRRINALLRDDPALAKEVRETHKLDVTGAELMAGKRSRTVVVVRNVTAEEVIADMAAKGVPLTPEQARAMADLINSKK